MVPALAGVPVSTEVLFGSPALAIVTAATNRKTDLIVMATHGHGPLMHALMGNVAERVVRTATCPVLTVREPREVENDRWATKGGVVAAAAAGDLVM